MRTATSAFSRVLSNIVDFSTACLSEHEFAEKGFGSLISTRIFGSLHVINGVYLSRRQSSLKTGK